MQWLKESVELPQYEKNFRDFRVTGNTLPRLVPCCSTVHVSGDFLVETFSLDAEVKNELEHGWSLQGLDIWMKFIIGRVGRPDKYIDHW